MNLNKQQVEAILSTISTQKNAEYKAKLEALTSDPATIKQAESILKELTAIQSKLEKLPVKVHMKVEDGTRNYGCKLNHIIDALTLKRRNSIRNNFDREDMRNKIVLASIDSETMSELQTKLNISF